MNASTVDPNKAEDIKETIPTQPSRLTTKARDRWSKSYETSPYFQQVA